jgi:Mce-associated membrane protein
VKRRFLFLAVPVVALSMLVAGLVVLTFRSSARAAESDARADALAVARQEALNLTTLSYEHADADLDHIVGLATGELRDKFEAERKDFPGVLAKEQSVSTGTVRSAGLVRLSADRQAAQAAIAVDAEISNNKTRNAGQPVVEHYRMVLQLSLVDGRWLVSDVAFAGDPQ